jgi:hypothetical protein
MREREREREKGDGERNRRIGEGARFRDVKLWQDGR